MAIEGCTFCEAKNISAPLSFGYQNKSLDILNSQSIHEVTGAFQLPKFASEKLPAPHMRYLSNRGFNPLRISREHKILACYTVGKYRHRIIIPILLNGTIVNFIARDITGQAKRKYLMSPNGLIHGNSLLYNLDKAGSSVVLVEGVFDAWRIGRGAVATLGTKVSEAKINLLVKHRPKLKRVLVAFDEDAQRQANKLAIKLKCLFPEVIVIEITDDPDSYFRAHPDDLKKLRGLME
jgi:DNA primase